MFQEVLLWQKKIIRLLQKHVLLATKRNLMSSYKGITNGYKNKYLIKIK